MSWKLAHIISHRHVGSAARKLLLLSMGDKANDDGSGVYASYATLAAMCDSSRSTVKRLIRDFLEEGLIRHVGLRPCANGDTNEFDLIVGAIEALPMAREVQDRVRKPRSATQAKMNPVQDEPGSRRTRSKGMNPVHHDPPTRFTMTPKPIQETFFLDSNESKNHVGKRVSKAKGTPKEGGGRRVYAPEFEALWRMWPASRRKLSHKGEAASRFESQSALFGAEKILDAAKNYLADPNVRKENFRYCRLAQVFLNGGLEAAIESLSEPRERVWSSALNDWVLE